MRPVFTVTSPPRNRPIRTPSPKPPPRFAATSGSSLIRRPMNLPANLTARTRSRRSTKVKPLEFGVPGANGAKSTLNEWDNMAAYLKNGKGDTGNLHKPALRARQLRRCAHLTLEEAGRKMGVGRERARHLYRIYGIKRKKLTRKTNGNPRS